MSQSSQTVAETAPASAFKEDNVWGKASRFLFGNDVFISYARRDTTIYSLGLANELTKNELSCFLDQWGTPSGQELPRQLVTALKRSNMLILLGTRQAAASKAVATEIREFKKTGRTIIPVSFDGSLEQAEWYQELIAGISIAHESSDALQSGKASEHVVSRIVNAENFTRRSKRLRRYFGLTAASVVMMLLAGALIAMFIVRQANAKVIDANKRLQEADTRAGQARAQADQAETNRKQAEAEANRLTGVAQKAQEDQQAAEEKADEAAQNEAVAKANADEQRRIADEQEKRNKRLSYIGNIRLAQQLAESERLEKVQTLLDDFRPELAVGGNKQSEDLRGYEWYHLWHLSHSILATIPLELDHDADDPEGSTTEIAVSSRLKQFATAKDGEVKVWNFSNATPGQPVATLKGGSVEYSPDQSILASVNGSEIRLWNAETLVAMEPIRHPTGKDFSSVVFVPPSGSRLAAAAEDGINIWDISQGKISKAIKTVPWPSKIQQLTERDFAFSPDGTRLGAESGGVIQIWEIPAGGGNATIAETLDQKNELEHMLFLPDNETVAIFFFEYEGDFQLWDVKSKTKKSEFKTDIGSGSSINFPRTVTAALSPDRPLLATGSKYGVTYGGGVRLWNIFTGKLIATLDGLGIKGNVGALAFSADGKTLAIRAPMQFAMPGQNSTESGIINAVQLSDTTAARASTELQSIRRPIKEMSLSSIEKINLSPDGNLLATIIGNENQRGQDMPLDSNNTRLFFWDTSTGNLAHTHPKWGVNSIAFSPDGSKYATATFIPETSEETQWLVELWDAHSHKPLGEPLGETSWPTLQFSPDGKTLAAAVDRNKTYDCDDTCIQFWNLASSERSVANGVGTEHDDSPFAYSHNDSPFAYSPNGKLFIVFRSIPDGSEVRIVETTTKKTLVRFGLQDQSSYNDVAFSPDGKTLAIAHDDSTVTLWDVSSLYKKEPPASPDTWDSKSKQFIDTLEGHTGSVRSVAFSPDGKTIATASDDGTVKLWDTRFYQLLATFSDYSGPIKFMFFTRDGSALITAGLDKTGNVTSVRVRRAATREEVALRSK